MATTLTCLTCGESLRPGDRYCSRCGDELALSSHPTALLDAEAHVDDDPESPWAEVVQRLRRATQGEFEIGRELGRGGMAAVFLAHEISLDRSVAIKVMSPGLLMGDGMIDRFKREAITIAHLNHPNIVSCYSVRQAAGLHFFVMRYIRGRSLEQVIHDAGTLPLPIVRSIFCQVGSALTYAHRSRVVHRDIKPANILIDEDGNAVVTDFGIAKVAELPGHTHTGALVGTPAYMSPEQCSGDEVSGASDQYALGAVAYEMLTGVAPFTGSSLTVMQAQVELPPPPIRQRCTDCPAEFEAAILRMLAKDPAERFPNMAEAKAALGATPLREDDPLLVELCHLAAAGSPEPRSSTPPTKGSSAVRSALAGQARSIVILPPPAELAKGDGFALIALVRGDRGVPLPGRTVEWSTDAPDVLHIDRARSVATAVAPGSALLTASCDGIQTQVPVYVPPIGEPLDLQAGDPAAAIQISSPPKSVRAGDSFVLTATPLDSVGLPLPEPTVLWNTSDVRVAVVTAGGWVAALGRGHVVLTASRGGASASVNIDVAHAIPTPRPARPPAHRVEPSAPAPLHRPSRRRRGSRSRGEMVKVAVGAVAVLASVWLFGGMRDFRWDRGQPSAVARDSGQTVGETARQAEPTESIATINQGAAASAGAKLRPRRPVQPEPPSPESLSIAPHDPLRAGDTVTLTAVVLDGQGEPIGDAGVTWTSSEPELAAVDSTTGTVHGQAPGTTLITARSGRETAVSELVVLPAETRSEPSGYVPLTPELERDEPPEKVASTPPALRPADRPPAEPADRRQLESRIREGVEDCYGAVRAKDLERLADMYHPKTYADEDKLRRLSRILRTEPWKAAVGKRVDGAREMGPKAAAAEFSFRLAWRDAHGGRLSSQPIFRAEFARDPEGWAMSSCRIVGSPKL